MTKFLNIKDKVKSFISSFSWDVGVDLGSSNTLVFLRDRGIIIDEPTMLVRPKKKRWTGLSAPKNNFRSPIAFGFKAKEMLNREPKQIEVVSPIKNGVIADLEALESLISYYLKLIYEIPSTYPKIFKPKMIVSVPSYINQVQKRALKSVFLNAGAKEVVLVESAVLAAIGIGLSIDSSAGLLVVDIGGGKTEVSVVSMGGVVVGRGIKTAGNDFDESIINYIKMKYGILIGGNSAERIKINLENSGVIRGRNLETGLPGEVNLTKSEILEAVSLELSKISKLVKTVLDETPPELMEDIVKKGIILVGNGSKISNLKEMIESETKIFTVIVDDSGMAVAKGCGRLVEDSNLLKQIRMVTS